MNTYSISHTFAKYNIVYILYLTVGERSGVNELDLAVKRSLLHGETRQRIYLRLKTMK